MTKDMPILPPRMAIRGLFDVIHKPAVAFRRLSLFRTMPSALSVLVAFVIGDALVETYLVNHDRGNLTLGFFQVPTSTTAWFVSTLVYDFVFFLSLVLTASFIACLAFKGRADMYKSISFLGYWYPWNMMLLWGVLLSLESKFVPLILTVVAIGLVAFIWLLWPLGELISLANKTTLRGGILSGMIAVLVLFVVDVAGPSVTRIVFLAIVTILCAIVRARTLRFGRFAGSAV